LEENYLFITSANISSHLTGQEEPAHYEMKEIQRAFEDPLHGRLERVRQRFAGFGGPVQEYLASLSCDEQLHCGPIEWVKLDRWYSGRVVLIGDAAHAGPPTMAEGG